MSFSALIHKLADASSLQPQEKNELFLEARRLEEQSALLSSIVVPGTKIVRIEGLVASDAEIDRARIDNATIDNATITDAAIESATAAGGDVSIGAAGIVFSNDANWLIFQDSSGNDDTIFISSQSDDALGLVNTAGGEINATIKTTDAATPQLQWRQDPAQVNRTQLNASPGAQGGKMGVGGEVYLQAKGASGGRTFIHMEQTTNIPTYAAGVNIYMKGDKLILQAPAGYFYIDISNAANTQWIYSAGAP